MPVYSIRLKAPLTGARFPGPERRPQGTAQQQPPESGQEPGDADKGSSNPQEDSRSAEQAALQQELKLLSQSMRAVNQRMTEQHAAVQELIGGLRRDVADLATAIAAQVIGEQEVSPQRVEQMVDHMLREFEVGDKPQVYLHPADHQLLQQVSEGADHSYHPRTDASLDRGSCRVEGPRFGFLRNWKHQVAAIRESLLEQIGE